VTHAGYAPDDCGPDWTTVPSPNPGAYSNSLNGVAAVSSTDVWAVGYSYDYYGGGSDSLIEHWDGTAWTTVPSPNPGTALNYLNGVAAVSSNDVWAVGYYRDLPCYK
jgi:hypothetical protein